MQMKREEPLIICDFCGEQRAYLQHVRHEGTTFVEIVCPDCNKVIEMQYDDPPGYELHIYLLSDGVVQIERIAI